MSSSARRAGVGTRPYVLLQGRPFWSAAILRGRRPAIRRGALPHFRGPRRSPAATAAGSVGKGAAAEGVSFAACGEAKDLELAAKRRIWSLRRRCHATRPPRRATAHCSAENTAGLRPACFSVCAVLCCPAPGRSTLLFYPISGQKERGVIPLVLFGLFTSPRR